MINNSGKFNVGDIVIYKGTRLHFPEFFPKPGTFGKVVYTEAENSDGQLGCWIDWPENSLDTSKTEGNHICYCKNYRLDLAIPADIVAINPKLVEDVLNQLQNK